MIHYHGGPIRPNDAAIIAWTRRHSMIPFTSADQLPLAAEVSQSFALDNGAFTAWKQGQPITDWKPYAGWVKEWYRHPAFDFALIPDVIEGNEADNDDLICWWLRNFGNRKLGEHPSTVSRNLSVPIWHLHESTERLARLCHQWPRVALGSSGEYAEIGNLAWWSRMSEAMTASCDEMGRPLAKLHGLRMLNPTVFSHLPLASADSTNVARNIGIDKAWRGPYQAMTPATRAVVLMERIEAHGSATRWAGFTEQMNMELVG